MTSFSERGRIYKTTKICIVNFIPYYPNCNHSNILVICTIFIQEYSLNQKYTFVCIVNSRPGWAEIKQINRKEKEVRRNEWYIQPIVMQHLMLKGLKEMKFACTRSVIFMYEESFWLYDCQFLFWAWLNLGSPSRFAYKLFAEGIS